MNRFSLFFIALAWALGAGAQMPKAIRVEGAHLVDEDGKRVLLHGVMDTPSPYFNTWRWGRETKDENVEACVTYFDRLFTAITDTAQGAYCNVFRLHLDPCWTNDPATPRTGDDGGEANISQFSEAGLRKYLDTLYWPIIRRGLNHGLHIVVRPPGVCPRDITVGGEYHRYLLLVWDIVSKHDSIRSHAGQVSLELANEPVNVLPDPNNIQRHSTAFNNNKPHHPAPALHDFFQPIVDEIRAKGYTGFIWVPGAGWQSHYEEYAAHPIEGENIGYAAHAYVGWYGCDDTATGDRFIEGFRRSVPVVTTNPIFITEVDWSPLKEGRGHYNEHGDWVPGNHGTWATGTTSGWGRAFKQMKDHFGNISMTLTATSDLIDIDRYLKDGVVEPSFDGNPEACAKACMDWYRDYHKQAIQQ